jgi:plasmid stabilization system protein ParE
MPLKVYVTETAEADLVEILRYTQLNFGANEKAKTLQEIQKAIDLTAEHPSFARIDSDHHSERFRFRSVRGQKLFFW